MVSSTFVVLLLLSLTPFSCSNKLQETFHECLSKFQTPNTFFTPNNSHFKDVLDSRSLNLRFRTSSTPKPDVIFTPLNETHIQTAVVCAKKLGIQLRVRSGGHDYEGVSYRSVSNSSFVVIDLSKMRGVSVDVKDNSVWAEAGATLGEVYYRVAEKSKNLGVAAGIYTSLGVGGHVTGGGYGGMMRKYGLAADQAIDARIVDANGEIVDRESMGPDVFWAIRGGGGGSFGIIVAWKLRLVHVPDRVTVFKVGKTLEQNGTNILYKWQQVAPNVDDNLLIRVSIKPTDAIGANKRTITTTYEALFLGRADELMEIMSDKFPELGLQKGDCHEMSWLKSVMLHAGHPDTAPPSDLLQGKPAFVNYFKSKSDFAKDVMPEQGLEGVWKIMLEGGESPFMIWNPYGGEMGRVSEQQIAFPHRDVVFMIQYVATWMDPKPETMTKHVRVLNQVYDYMTPYVTKSPRQAYVNYRDLDLGMNELDGDDMSYANADSWGTMYFKASNFQKLVEFKTKFDPDNFFWHEQSIPVLTNKNAMLITKN